MTARIAGHPSERRFHMQSAGLAKADYNARLPSSWRYRSTFKS
jgi:hypothetical protein